MVAVGLTTYDPLADVDEKFPGVTTTLVAPWLVQLSVVLVPAVMPVGLPENDVIVGAGTCLMVGNAAVQPASPTHPKSKPASAQATCPGVLRKPVLDLPSRIERAASMRSLSLVPFIASFTAPSLATYREFSAAILTAIFSGYEVAQDPGSVSVPVLRNDPSAGSGFRLLLPGQDPLFPPAPQRSTGLAHLGTVPCRIYPYPPHCTQNPVLDI